MHTHSSKIKLSYLGNLSMEQVYLEEIQQYLLLQLFSMQGSTHEKLFSQ